MRLPGGSGTCPNNGVAAGATGPQVAYIILAHSQPRHLAKLIDALDGAESAFFVHIDAKVDEKMFNQLVSQKSNVTFIAQRFRVNWGGFSQVAATLALLSAALDSPRRFDRFCLLSGADFPIKPKSRITADLNSSGEFIRIDRKLDPDGDDTRSRYVNVHWFVDPVDPTLSDLSGKLRRRPYAGMPLYHGAQWWALTRDCVQYILRFVSSETGYSSFLKTTLCPDEIFFHSIVKNSPFASRITHDFETAGGLNEYLLSNEHGCHYIDWNDPVGPLPKVLDLRDFDKLQRSKSLFGRKFDERQSHDLLVRLAVQHQLDCLAR